MILQNISKHTTEKKEEDLLDFFFYLLVYVGWPISPQTCS